MSTRVNRDEFLKLLTTVTPGLSQKDSLEQSSRFVFSAGWVITYNGEVSCRVRTELPEDLEGAVHSDPLMKVLAKLPDDDIDVSLGKGELLIHGKGKRVGVRMEPEIVLPLEQIEKPAGWEKLPPDFGDAVKIVQETTGTNDEQFLTVVVHLHPEWLESCDRRQATRYRIKTGLQKSCLVRQKSVKHMVPLGMTKFSETDNWIHFRNPKPGVIFSCRRYVENYPSLEKMFDFRGTKINLPKGAAAAAELASIFTETDKDNNRVTVRLSEERGMEVYGEGAHGWASQDVGMIHRGEPTEFRISPTLLASIVSVHEVGEIGPNTLRVDGERWTYVTRLGKIRNESDNGEPGEAPKKRRKAPTEVD